MKSRILVIDDEAAIRDSLRMILEYEGYEMLGAATGEEGIGVVEREAVDLVFLDIKMPGMDGLEVLGRLKKVAESLPVVMISGHATVSTAVEATKVGAFDFVEKPLTTERVLLTIRNALGFTKLRDENRNLQRAVEARTEMVGASPVLDQVRGVGAPGGADHRHGAHPGRKRRGQGTGRPHDPRQQPAQPRAVHPGELRGHPGRPDGIRTVRT